MKDADKDKYGKCGSIYTINLYTDDRNSVNFLLMSSFIVG